MVPGRDSFTLMKHEYPYSRNNNSFLSIIMWECSWHVCSKALHANCRMAEEKWFGETWQGGQRDEWVHSHYLNETSFYELLVSGKKAMIDLREDHLSRCVRSRGRRSKVREGWRRMKSQKKEEEEEGGGNKMQKRTDFVRKACVHEPRTSIFTDLGEIHTYPLRRRFASEVWLYFFGA